MEGLLTILPTMGSIGRQFCGLSNSPGPRRKVEEEVSPRPSAGHIKHPPTRCLSASSPFPQTEDKAGIVDLFTFGKQSCFRDMCSTRQQRERQCVSHAQTRDEAVARKSSDVTEGQQGQPRPCVTTQGLCLACVEGVTFGRGQVHVPKAGKPKGGHVNTHCYLWQVTPRPCAGTVTLERVSVTGCVSVCSGCHSEGWQNGRLKQQKSIVP